MKLTILVVVALALLTGGMFVDVESRRFSLGSADVVTAQGDPALEPGHAALNSVNAPEEQADAAPEWSSFVHGWGGERVLSKEAASDGGDAAAEWGDFVLGWGNTLLEWGNAALGWANAALEWGGNALQVTNTASPISASEGEMASALPAVKADGQVVAEAKVVPVQSAALSVPTGGIVEKLLVAEGDGVEAGQVLLKLGSARQVVAVSEAEAGLSRAQARLDELKNGPRPMEIEAAEAAVLAAQAQLSKARQGARAEEVAVAEASLAVAQAMAQQSKEGPDENQLIAAKAELSNADAQVRQTRAAYDRVSWASDIAIRPEAVQLEQATNAYNAAKARFDRLQKEPGGGAVAAALAKVQQAQAEVDRVKAPPRPADLAPAEAEIRRARAQLELLKAGNRPETIAMAEADVAAAKATLEQARVALAETELRAPAAGVVASLDAAVGELVTPGTPIVRLADLSSWQFETTDLTELSVTNVQEGDAATIAVDAIPGLVLSGKIVRIKPIGQSKQGDINYTVIIKPDRLDKRLRWNMTASVTIHRK